jgi:predicted DNA-binding WGR domain protein
MSIKIRRFELIDEKNYKFWEIWTERAAVHRRSGMVGTNGRTVSKEYSDDSVAENHVEILVEEKLNSGYQEVEPSLLYKLQSSGLSKLEKAESSPLIKKSIRIYTETSTLFCEPAFRKFDPKRQEHRLLDQIVGGFPYTSSTHPWPRNKAGTAMQFLAQIDLAVASKLLEEDFGAGLLQVFAHDHELCDKFLFRIIPNKDLSAPPDLSFPEEVKEFNCSGMINLGGMEIKGSRVEWKPPQLMHYPSIWSRICGGDEKVECIYPPDVDDALSDLVDEDDWAISINRPLLHGLRRGRRCPNVYLGGYPFAEGNGWNLHHPSRRSLLNIWSDSGVLWHFCLYKNSENQLSTNFACTR